MTATVKTRHYKKSQSLVRRDLGDLTEEAIKQRTFSGPFSTTMKPARPQDPQLISSCQGPFKRLLLTIPEYAVRDPSLSAVFQDLLKQLPNDTQFTILRHDAVEKDVKDWHAASGNTKAPEIATIGNHLHFSVWAEDGYVTISDSKTGQSYFVEPFSFPRYGDGLIAEFISNATDMHTTQAPLYFQGGNCLVGDKFFLIGADYPAKTVREYVGSILHPPAGAKIETFVRDLYKDYLDHARDLIYVGSTIPVPSRTAQSVTINGQTWTEILYAGNKKGTAQPLFHIDMFLTLIGRDAGGQFHIMIGDPNAACDILGHSVPAHAMRDVFDNIAKNFDGLGFKVHRNPLPLVYMDDPGRKERMWYFATANNALVSLDGAKKSIWLPTYGHGAWPELKATDLENKKIWASLGFTVYMLGDFHPFAENLGAVHCIKKYLAR